MLVLGPAKEHAMSHNPRSYSVRYDLEGNRFYESLFAAATSIGGGPLRSWDKLLEQAPQDAYIVAVELPLEYLVTRFRALCVVERLIACDQFPVSTPKGPLLREQWIRAARDVFLARVT